MPNLKGMVIEDPAREAFCRTPLDTMKPSVCRIPLQTPQLQYRYWDPLSVGLLPYPVLGPLVRVCKLALDVRSAAKRPGEISLGSGERSVWKCNGLEASIEAFDICAQGITTSRVLGFFGRHHTKLALAAGMLRRSKLNYYRECGWFGMESQKRIEFPVM